ncbi:MAG: hypothetical protein WDN45_02445 [Caulobacteraceae bacterium]
MSPEIVGDPTGAKVRLAMDRLADDFSAVYGQPLKLDSCKGGACVPDLWGEDLQTGDRRYGYRWEMHEGPAHAVREVSVIAVAHKRVELRLPGPVRLGRPDRLPDQRTGAGQVTAGVAAGRRRK